MSGREVTFQAMLRAITTNRMDLIALRPCQILIPFSMGARSTHFHPPSFTAFAAQSALSMGPSTRHGDEILLLER